MLRPALLTLTLSTALIWPAHAVEVAKVQVPEQVVLENQNLSLNGAGLRRKAIFDVYVAALYTPAPSQNAEQLVQGNRPQQIRLYLRRNLSADTLLEALKEGLEKNLTAAEQSELQTAIGQFEQSMKKIGSAKKGDQVTLNLYQEKISIDFNEQHLADIEHPGMPAALLKIWLGAHPAQESLKNALLGLSQ